MPEGTECSTYFSRPTTTVWPALLPPWYRTTTFTCGVSTSTTLPLPSSPHCVPTTTMLGMTPTSREILEHPLRSLQHLRDPDGPLRAPGEVDHQRLTLARAPAADDEHAGGALAPSVGERLGQRAADDVARHRGAAVAQAPGQRERRRLVGRG